MTECQERSEPGRLLALGMVMLYSSSMTESGTQLLRTQLIWCGLGLVAWAILALARSVSGGTVAAAG